MSKCRLSILSITANALKASKHGGHGTMPRWSRPDARHIKLNVDASFFEDSHAEAVGAVLRDWYAGFVAASTMFLPHVSSASMAEAIAMREGLQLAIAKGCNRIIAESDSVEIIAACTGQEAWWSESAAVFANCVDLATTIGIVDFKHCPREANLVAHELARTCFTDKISCNWDDDPPRFLLGKILNDITI